MDKFELICNLIIAILGVIPTFISLVMLVRNVIKEKNWQLIVKMANDAMTTVEEYAKEHPEMTSDEKLEMALEAIKSGLTEAGIAFDENLVKQIVEYIKEMCSWSKTVNANEQLEEGK